MSPSEHHVYRITGIITAIMSVLSMCGALWLIVTSYRKKKHDKEDRDFLVNDYVFYMSMWDLLINILILLYWGSVGFDYSLHWDNHQELCQILGAVFQLSWLSSATWSFFIVINLFRLLAGTANDDLKSKTLCQIGKCKIMNNHIIVWTVAIIFTLIPITHYGETSNPENVYSEMEKYECWIYDQRFQMALYVPIAIYVVTSFYIFCWIGCRRCNLVPSGDRRTEALQNKLAAFSVLFFSVWLFPTINRFWALIKNDSPPIPFVVLHHVSLSCIGFGNFLIWIVIYPISLKRKQKSIREVHVPQIIVDNTFNQLLAE